VDSVTDTVIFAKYAVRQYIFLLSSKDWEGGNTRPVQDTALACGKIRTDYLTITCVKHVHVEMYSYNRGEL
jgi:hypothetical protein